MFPRDWSSSTGGGGKNKGWVNSFQGEEKGLITQILVLSIGWGGPS